MTPVVYLREPALRTSLPATDTLLLSMQKRAHCETNGSQELCPSLCYNYHSAGKQTAFFVLEMTCRQPGLEPAIMARG